MAPGSKMMSRASQRRGVRCWQRPYTQLLLHEHRAGSESILLAWCRLDRSVK